MKVDGFTISYSFETSTQNHRASNFVSVNFKLPEPLGLEDVESLRMEASKKVTMWAVQDALMRGEISSDEAKERISIIKANFDGLKSASERSKK